MRGKGKGDMVIMVGHSCWCYLKHEYDMSGFNHSSSSDIAAENLRDLSQSIDVPLLDATVAAFYSTGSKQEVLEGLIKYRWNALPAEQRDGMNSEFQLIHELWLYVLSSSQRAELILATPSTIHVFLSWIPLGFIFESPLLETLLKFIPVPAYRNLTLQCLTEVASIQFGRFYDVQYVKMYGICMGQLQVAMGITYDVEEKNYIIKKVLLERRWIWKNGSAIKVQSTSQGCNGNYI
ncbi:protein EXPORTIN 1A [Trifolium repens]|nr:protein EXPORTIN 1A [Trifolium repens]